MPRPLTGRIAAPAFLSLSMALSALSALLWPSSARAADPTTAECVQLNEGAAPLRKEGKLLEAHASLVRCSAKSCPSVVRDDCARGAVQADAAIPTVVFEVRDATGNDLSHVRLTVDGVERSDRLTGVPLEVDPGEHVFRFEADGYLPIERKYVMHAAEKNRLERVPMASASAPAPAAKPIPPPPASSGGSLRATGLVVGGVGIAGLVVGGIFGWTAHTTWNRAVTECNGGCPEGAPARGLSSSAHTDALISDIGFAAGGALTAAGLIMFLVAPHGSSTTGLQWSPVVGRGVAGLSAGWAIP